jgi:hypothetical protein
MKVTNQRMTIEGALPVDFTPDGGSRINKTKIFCAIELDQNRGRGRATQEYAWGGSENFDKIKHLPFPFEADVDLEMVTNGRGTMNTLILDMRPVKREPERKAA